LSMIMPRSYAAAAASATPAGETSKPRPAKRDNTKCPPQDVVPSLHPTTKCSGA
jgi:hypothetical protein